MANEPSWEDIFTPAPDAAEPAPVQRAPVESAPAEWAPAGTALAPLPGMPGALGVVAPVGAQAMTRRELREREGRRAPAEAGGGTLVGFDAGAGAAGSGAASSGAASAGGGRSGGGRGGRSSGGAPRRRFLWLKITLPIVIVLALLGGAGAYAWINYETKVREILGWQLPIDYKGTGNGQEVIVTIQSGDIGSDVSKTLTSAGVTMTFKAFYNLLLVQKTDVKFLPGNYRLQKQMSAQAALDALVNPANKVTDKLLIVEGTTLPRALTIIADTTGIPLADLQTASRDLASFGLPAQAPSLEGYLFPATYQLDKGQTAHGVLKLMVDTMFEHLTKAGVAPADRHRVLTMAALIQREAGPNPDDFYKISRVFTNRLDQGINLESDATVAYGTGNFRTVFTTNAERADASNPYNTYVHPGLPVGPIGLPGDLAIAAAIAPVPGSWLFFVPINLATGETVFSTTVSEHDAAVAQLRKWCAAPENAVYCQ